MTPRLPDTPTLPERLAQGQRDCWLLLTSLRPLHAHEDAEVQEAASDATANLVALLRKLNEMERLIGEGNDAV